MDEILKYAVEGGSFGVSLFIAYLLFKKFIENDVIKPIEDIQAENKELKSSFTAFTERITSFVFRLIKSNQELSDRVTKEVTGMHNLFTETTKHTTQARLESYEALKKVNENSETTDKLVKIAGAVHQENKALKTEVKRISDELILVKTKVSKNEN